MSGLTACGPTLRECLLRLSRSRTEPLLRARRRRGQSSARRLAVRLMFEELEDYALLSASIIGTGIDRTSGGPACGKAITPHASVTGTTGPCPLGESGVPWNRCTTSSAVRSAASRSPGTSATIVPLGCAATIASDPRARLTLLVTRRAI